MVENLGLVNNILEEEIFPFGKPKSKERNLRGHKDDSKTRKGLPCSLLLLRFPISHEVTENLAKLASFVP